MAQTITEQHIKDYLDTRDDFELELFAYQLLTESGWFADLGGSYFDPFLGKPRQFDIRARRELPLSSFMNLAIECKSLTQESPLIVLRVPRPARESQHDVIRRFRRTDNIHPGILVDTSPGTVARLYEFNEPVGKSAMQISLVDASKGGLKIKASDSESYEKWAQALASASELVLNSTVGSTEALSVHEFVMPVLLINDDTLWAVDYNQKGFRGDPKPIQEATLFVSRKQNIETFRGTQTYHLSHLHIYTRTAFSKLLTDLSDPNSKMHERIFGFAIRAAAQRER